MHILWMDWGLHKSLGGRSLQAFVLSALYEYAVALLQKEIMKPQIITEEQFQAMQQRVRKTGPVSAAADLQGAGGHRKVSAVPSSPYKSKWEAAYASKLELEKQAGYVRFWKYEPFALWLPGKIRYKPDFLVQSNTDDDPLEIVEVKGWSKNRRDGMTRLKMAAALFPCFVWRMVYRNERGGWDGEYI